MSESLFGKTVLHNSSQVLSLNVPIDTNRLQQTQYRMTQISQDKIICIIYIKRSSMVGESSPTGMGLGPAGSATTRVSTSRLVIHRV